MFRKEWQSGNNKIGFGQFQIFQDLFEQMRTGMNNLYPVSEFFSEQFNISALEFHQNNFRFWFAACNNLFGEGAASRTKFYDGVDLFPINSIHHGAAGNSGAGYDGGVPDRIF